MAKVLHHRFAVSRVQHTKDVVVIHHLPKADTPFQVVMEHVRHAINGIKPGGRKGKGSIVLDRRFLLQISLQPGIQERIVHLGSMEMDLHLHIGEEIHLAFLIDDIKWLIGAPKRLQDGIVRSFHPNVDIAAHPPLRNWIETG